MLSQWHRPQNTLPWTSRPCNLHVRQRQKLYKAMNNFLTKIIDLVYTYLLTKSQKHLIDKNAVKILSLIFNCFLEHLKCGSCSYPHLYRGKQWRIGCLLFLLTSPVILDYPWLEWQCCDHISNMYSRTNIQWLNTIWYIKNCIECLEHPI